MMKELLDLTSPQYHLGTENDLITPKITVDIIVIFSMYSTYMCTCLYVLLVCSSLRDGSTGFPCYKRQVTQVLHVIQVTARLRAKLVCARLRVTGSTSYTLCNM